MLPYTRLTLVSLFIAHVVLASAAAQVQAQEQATNEPKEQATYTAPVSAFSILPEYTSTTLSPNGNKIAYVQNFSSPEEIAVLRTFNTKTNEVKLLLSSDNKKVKINWFKWANNDVLIVSASYESRRRSLLYYQTRMYSVDTTDDKPELKIMLRQRASSSIKIGGYVSQYQDRVIDFLPNDPDHVLVEVDFDVPQEPSVYKVNVYTARKSRIEKGKRNIRNWYTDQQHQVRIGRARNYDTGKITYYHRLTEDSDFSELLSYTSFEDKPISVRGFGLDPNILYISQYKGDKLALYKMNISTKETTLMLAHDDYDVGGNLIYSTITKEAIGVVDAHSPFGKYYFADIDYNFHRALDNALPDTDNFITSFSEDESVYILYTESDSSAGQYLLGNRKNNTLDYLFSAYPELDFIDLPEHESMQYTTRDGLEIEAIVTLPKFGKAPYPTVIHPHGGPGARDYEGFDPWVSYMSSKGYAVVRPNFRGSTGYGYEFAQAQMQGWGLEMQDDISDATTHLIKEGIIDPTKVCIFGASYGGYAAFMATTKTPDLYTCAVSFAGVSDLRDLASSQKRYLGGDLVAEKQLGDDRDDLLLRSPITHVKNIKTPLLIMHGTEDRSVSVKQSRDFVDELKDENKTHKYVEFEYGDHYLSIAQNRRVFFEELDAFFTQHLGTISP